MVVPRSRDSIVMGTGGYGERTHMWGVFLRFEGRMILPDRNSVHDNQTVH